MQNSIPVRGFRRCRKSAFRVPLLHQQIGQVRVWPVVLRMVFLHQADRFEEMRSSLFIVAPRLPAKTEIVPSLVMLWIELQSALELSDRLIDISFLIEIRPNI